MCLTLPKRVISIAKNSITVKAGKKNEFVGTLLPVKRGDWVLTQNRLIIKKITAKQADEINGLFKIK